MTAHAANRALLYEDSSAAGALSDARRRRPTIVAALLVGLAYFLGTKFGLALTFVPHPISTLWPPNAILLAALLLTAPRVWWMFILAAFPAHLAGELQGGVPTIQVLAWFASNCSEALIGAATIRWLVRGPLRFNSFRHVSIFVACGAFLAPFLSSFLDVALVKQIGWGHGEYWDLWRLRFFSNVVASLALVPFIVTWATSGRAAIGRASLRRHAEAGLLTLGLLIVSIAVFLNQMLGPSATPVLLYAPVPFLLWAAVRMGPLGTSGALLVLVFVAIWGTLHGQGPFIATSAEESALSVQLFLVVVSVPLLFLAAVIEDGKRTSAALRSSEERFAKAFRLSPDAVVITRLADAQIIDVNDRWVALFGYGHAEAVGRTLLDLGIYRSADDFRQVTERVGVPGGVRHFELALATRSGAVLQTILAVEIAEMGGEPCYISIMRDVTEQRRVEREAQESRRQMTHLTRVAVLGQLSGALAHELNQPLTAILSNAQAAQRFLGRETVNLDELREIVRDIIADDKRAGEVIRRLRALLQRGETQFQPFNVNDVAIDALELAHGELVARNVTATTHLGRALPAVRGDRVQLQQVLLNLIVNACEAMSANGPGERRLTVATKLDAAGNAQVSVTDCGPGIPAERREKLFEPFFTTKEHGLGLGLSISRSIITAHAGRLWAEDNTDRGATFHVMLPALTTEPS